jgi:glycosyltransferase involved in cell wall biosynthesis
MPLERKRVTLVADELLGFVRTGGIGTATTFLSLALARMGHEVELLYVGDPPARMGPDWQRLYDEAAVSIRHLERSTTRVEPPHFGRMRDVDRALRARPPDVVITQDLAAPVYTALRLRRLGLAHERTLFVVYCHGTRQWITDMARKVRVLPGALAITALERASVELADVIVSPSAYLVDWMRQQRWRLPSDTRVVPYLARSVATGEPPPPQAESNGRVKRLVFFGRLEERKGLQPFLAALNALDPDLLDGIDLEFLGRATDAWPPERIEQLVSARAKTALRRIAFETELDQPEALARISRSGTLVVIPSFGETFSNAVYECLERRVPMIASNAGAPPELVAAEDHERVLFEPTAEGIAAALRRCLSNGEGVRPARLAFDPHDAADAWADVVATAAVPPSSPAASNATEWAVLHDDDDVLDDGLEETLLRAQSAADADVVTCGIRVDDVEHLFAGEAGGLALLSNSYGTVGLIRRSLLTGGSTPWPAQGDRYWPLYAKLSAAGARIVSVPLPLATCANLPGSLERQPGDALLVAQALEGSLPRPTAGLARLAAGLAADAQRDQPAQRGRPTFLRRVSRRVRRR